MGTILAFVIINGHQHPYHIRKSFLILMIKKRQIVTSLRAAFQLQAMEKWAMGSKPFGEKNHHGGCWDENSDDQWWLMMVTKLYKPKHPRVTNRVARTGRNTGVANLGIIVMALRNKMICWWWFWCVYQLWFDMKSRLRKSENNDHDDGILALHDKITYLQEWEWLWEHWASRSLRCKEPETKQTFLTNCWWWGLVWWGGRISNKFMVHWCSWLWWWWCRGWWWWWWEPVRWGDRRIRNMSRVCNCQLWEGWKY